MYLFKVFKRMIALRRKLLFVFFSLMIISGVIGATDSYAVYDVPNNDADCPANCRQIPWSAGSDQWNGGTLPNYTTEVICNTAHDGATDDTATINSCLSSIPANQVVKLPAGTHRINGTIRFPSNKSVVLRGVGPATVLVLYNDTDGVSTIENGYPSKGPQIGITSGYTKGSTSLVLSDASTLVVGDWISIFEDADYPMVTISGEIGNCTWCGESNGTHVMQQFAQITSKNSNTIGISRPMYYTFKPGLNPSIKKVNSWSATKVGIENMKIQSSPTRGSGLLVNFNSCLYCWVKGVETYLSGNSSNNPHIFLKYSHGVEVRDSYFHHGLSYASGSNYGVEVLFWNSDHKIENNIMLANRHSIAFEGGGSGCVILYNYIDDNYTDDTSYLGSARTNHGAHPFMNLYEGNYISHMTADDYWGSSSHMVFFRNWLRGANTGTNVPSPPSWGFYAIDVWRDQNYYSYVGNILGDSSWTSGILRTSNSSNCGSNGPVAYRYGCNSDSSFYSTASTTSINHGNFDYISDSVAYWEGGVDYVLKNSMYYTSKPAFFGNSAWPPFGPDLNPMIGSLPAKDRYNGINTKIPSVATDLKFIQ